MKPMIIVLLMTVMCFSGTIVKKERKVTEGVSIINTQKINRMTGKAIDTVVTHDTIMSYDTVSLLCTYIDTLLLVRTDTIQKVPEKLKKKPLKDILDSIQNQPKKK